MGLMNPFSTITSTGSKEPRMEAQDIVQQSLALRTYQYILERYPERRESYSSKIEELSSEIRLHIEAWGGIGAIDKWLEEHDPGHAQLSQIEEMDWSWLSSPEIDNP